MTLAPTVPPRRTAFVLACLAFGALAAQPPSRFAQIDNTVLPLLTHEVTAIVSTDLDGDGDQDLILGRRTTDMVLINQGGGRFTDGSARLPSVSGYTTGLVLGDVDGDGDLDLVAGTGRGKDRLFLNDGSGNFTDVSSTSLTVDGGATSTIALADVDGDNDLDLLVGSAWRTGNFISLNDGRGRFTTVGAALPTSTTRIEPLDVDGDGDVDLLLLAGGQPLLWLNNGRGVFQDVTAAALPAGIIQVTAIAVGDVDRDGDADAVLTPLSGSPVLLLGDGRGRFFDRSLGRMPRTGDQTTRLLMADLDGDAAPELVLGNDDLFARAGQRDRLFKNDGSGTFTDATLALGFPDVGFRVEALAAVDVDGDRDLDVFVGGDPGALRLLMNDGTARLTQLNAPFLARDRNGTEALAAGDVDGDGDVDIALGGLPRISLLLNNGYGRFSDGTEGRLPLIALLPPSIALQDIDGDGDLDLLHSGNGLFLNDGRGVFTDASNRLPQDPFVTRDMAFGDVDGDGDVDIVLGKERAQNRLYLNDGLGRFTDVTATQMPVDAFNTFALDLGDIDGDGDLDLAVGNMTGPNSQGIDRIYVNDGRGTFTMVARLPAYTEPTRDLAFGDFDGDGDLDLTTVTATALGAPGRDRLYFNDGRGNFTDVSAGNLPLMGEFTFALGVADVDADGDLDLVHGNDDAPFVAGSPQNRLLLNDGKGVFADATAQWLPSRDDLTQSVLLADFDGDRDVDVVFGNSGAGPADGTMNRLYFNLSQHLIGPGLVRTGTTHEVQILHWIDAPVQTRFAIVAASLRPARVPLGDLGVLGVDVATGLVWPTQQMPAAASTLQHRYAIPNLPSLKDTVLYEQALVFDALRPTSTYRLTNTIAQRIY